MIAQSRYVVDAFINTLCRLRRARDICCQMIFMFLVILFELLLNYVTFSILKMFVRTFATYGLYSYLQAVGY